eukprot:Amastigsp_a175324_206.p2 type:complete len:317 gc:universal Amastigsp_a175324_206:1527-577(-)
MFRRGISARSVAILDYFRNLAAEEFPNAHLRAWDSFVLPMGLAALLEDFDPRRGNGRYPMTSLSAPTASEGERRASAHTRPFPLTRGVVPHVRVPYLSPTVPERLDALAATGIRSATETLAARALFAASQRDHIVLAQRRRGVNSLLEGGYDCVAVCKMLVRARRADRVSNERLLRYNTPKFVPQRGAGLQGLLWSNCDVDLRVHDLVLATGGEMPTGGRIGMLLTECREGKRRAHVKWMQEQSVGDAAQRWVLTCVLDPEYAELPDHGNVWVLKPGSYTTVEGGIVMPRDLKAAVDEKRVALVAAVGAARMDTTQ